MRSCLPSPPQPALRPNVPPRPPAWPDPPPPPPPPLPPRRARRPCRWAGSSLGTPTTGLLSNSSRWSPTCGACGGRRRQRGNTASTKCADTKWQSTKEVSRRRKAPGRASKGLCRSGGATATPCRRGGLSPRRCPCGARRPRWRPRQGGRPFRCPLPCPTGGMPAWQSWQSGPGRSARFRRLRSQDTSALHQRQILPVWKDRHPR
mmetsp:Transcript_18814/g.71652  ORF Transcript_18814/g.71652 Transcript_18814/m.71652 type:complete len:205 (-) Transcript_18814:408-1022(-)